MKRVYTSANGKQINLDALIAQNEDTIAVGNMKVNARGDQLGAGGKVEKSKDQVMSEYYKLNTPTAIDTPILPRETKKSKDLIDDWLEPIPEDIPDTVQDQPPIASENQTGLRGSLADSVAKSTLPEQQPKNPKRPNNGPTRI
jgi:hypothetical protein